MSIFKGLKYTFLPLVLAIGISVITSQNVFAATLTTKTYTVKSGDCLFSIARDFGESINDLRKANNKWDDSICPGQVLNVSVTINPKVQRSIPTSTKYTAGDIDLLARLITAEARGETYNAQIAVGAVVLNRVHSTSFPNSISAVINQRVNGCYQFTPVKNGHINKPAQANAIKAAYEALSGNDPTNRALFYYDNTSASAFILSRPISIRIDHLIFAY